MPSQDRGLLAHLAALATGLAGPAPAELLRSLARSDGLMVARGGPPAVDHLQGVL